MRFFQDRKDSAKPQEGRLALRRDVPVAAALADAFRTILRYALDMASHADDDTIVAVHEYRKAVRRARSILRVLEPTHGGEKWHVRASRDLRRCHRATSPLRDIDILHMAFDLLPAGPGLTQATDELRAAIDRMAPDPIDTHEVLEKGARRIMPLLYELDSHLPADMTWDPLVVGIQKTYEDAWHDRARATRSRRLEHIHDWRKRTKELAYQLELVTTGRDLPAGTLRKQAADLAKQLGQITDLAVLCAHIGPARREGLGKGTALGLRHLVEGEIQGRLFQVLASSEELFRFKPSDLADELDKQLCADAPPRPDPVVAVTEPKSTFLM